MASQKKSEVNAPPGGKRRKRAFVRKHVVRRKVMLTMGWYDYQVNLGVAAYAQKAEWILNDDAGRTHAIPLDWECDGILVSLPEQPDAAERALLQRHIPTVDLRNEYPQPLPRVVEDNEAIGRMAAEHLLSRGFTDLAYYQAYASRVEMERMAGFKAAVGAAGRAFHHVDMSRPPAHSSKGDRRLTCLAELIGKLPKPIGVMAQFDGSASEFIRACELARVLVPEQAAVTGVDNDPITSELGLIPLTSVDTDRFRHGYEAAALLDRLMKGESSPSEIIRIPPLRIEIRRSTNIIAVPNTQLSCALAFIWEHFTEPIQVGDVIEASGTSRRTLFKLFKLHLNRTVMDEIHRLRITRAKQLLAETGEKAFSIAIDCGYRNDRHLNKNFQRLTGTTPSAFRAGSRPARLPGG